MAYPTATYGARTKRAVADGTGSFTVSPPDVSSGDDHTRIIVISQASRTVTWTVGSSFTELASLVHDSSAGCIRIYRRVGVSSGTVSLQPSAGVDAIIDTFKVDGPIAANAGSATNGGWTGTVAAPSVTAANAESLWVQIVMGCGGSSAPRRFGLASGVTALSSLTDHGYLGALAIGTKQVGSGATGTGTTWSFLDTESPYNATTSPPLSMSLAISPSSGGGGGGGTPPTQTTGSAATSASTSSLAVTLPAASTGNTHLIAVGYKPKAVTLTPPAGFEMLGNVDISDAAGRGVLLKLTRTAAYAGGSVNLTFSNPVSVIAVPQVVAGQIDDAQSLIQATWATTGHTAPSVTSGGIDALWMQYVITPEWARSWTPPAGVTEHRDAFVSGGQSIAIGSKAVGSGATGLGATWTPRDADTPVDPVVSNSIMFSVLFRDGGGTGGTGTATLAFGGRIPTIPVASATITSSPAINKGGTAQIKVLVKGSDGLPYQGISVALTSGSTGVATVASSPQTTDANGEATFTLNGVNVGTTVLTANADSGAATATGSASVTEGVTPGSASFAAVSVVAGASKTVTVTVLGTNGAAYAGASVALSSSATGTATVTGSPQTTNVAGQATFTVNGVAAGTATLTASVSSGLITTTAPVIVSAVAPPPVATEFAGSPWGRLLRGR